MKLKPLTTQLREVIAQCGMSEAELARELGCHRSALSRFMSGERGVSAKLLDRIGERFGLSITISKKGK